MAYTQASLVLDWQDNENPPLSRLSVFVNLSSNARRLESIQVRKGDFTWNIDSPILFESAERQWAGSPRLQPPAGRNGSPGVFEEGLYTVECVDASGEKAAGTFTLSYNAALLNAKAGEVEGILRSPQKRFALYSDSNELLYYDAAKDNWRDDEAIFKGVKDSSFYRSALSAGSAVCFMPKIFKDGEKTDGLE